METLSKPAKSKRKVHADKTPKEAPPPSNGMDADTFLVYMSKIDQEEARVAAAKKRLSKVWKLFLNEGGVRKDAELVRKFLNQDQPDAALAMMQRIKQYASWLDLPLGSQISLFEIPNSSILNADERADKAYRAGYVLGVQGKNPDAQAYPADHEFHQKHMEGWHAGQKVLLDRIGKIDIALESDKKAAVDDDAEEGDEHPDPDAENLDEREHEEA